MIGTIYLHVNRRAYVTCNCNCFVETKGLVKVTASHVHNTCGNVSEKVQDRDVITTDH